MMYPIKLVFFQMSDFRYEIKRNFVTFYPAGILTENPGRFVSTNTNNWSWFLVDPVDDEDVEEIVHELILQLWQVI
jgi:hypothetical protein